MERKACGAYTTNDGGHEVICIHDEPCPVHAPADREPVAYRVRETPTSHWVYHDDRYAAGEMERILRDVTPDGGEVVPLYAGTPPESREDEAIALGEMAGRYEADGRLAEAVGKMKEMGYDAATLNMLSDHLLGGVAVTPPDGARTVSRAKVVPEKPTPPEGGWQPESPECPYIDGLPLMAWVSWKLQSGGVSPQSPLAALLVEVAYLACGRNHAPPGAGEWQFVLEGAVMEAADLYDDQEGCYSEDFANNVGLAVICRVFDDWQDIYDEWSEPAAKEGFFWWGRAFGAFLRRHIDAHRAPAEGEE